MVDGCHQVNADFWIYNLSYSYIYIGQHESKKQFKQYVAQSKYQESKSTSAKHQAATNTYLSTANDAYIDHRKGKDRDTSLTIKAFQVMTSK